MAGMKVVSVKVTATGDLDMEDLREKAVKHKDNLAAFMVTYPSTFGVFEEGVQEACQIVHDNGGQVYLDGQSDFCCVRMLVDLNTRLLFVDRCQLERSDGSYEPCGLWRRCLPSQVSVFASRSSAALG